MPQRFVLLLIAAVLFSGIMAQDYKPVLQLRKHNTEHLSEYFTYWLQSFDQPENVAIADSFYRKGAFVHWKWHKSLSLGDARKRLWVRLVVFNTDTANATFVYSIHDFLDTATLWQSKNSGFARVCTATFWDIAKNRIFPARPLCLPFELLHGQTTILYLSVDQHNNNLYFPLHVRSAADLLKDEQNFIIDQYWFWLVGFYLFSIAFNLILFSFLRDHIYLWYCLYVLLNTTFLLMEDSLDGLILTQWLYSFVWHWGQYSFLLLSTSTGIRIMQSFTGQKERQPRLYRIGLFLFSFSFVFALFILIVENFMPFVRLHFINFIKTGRDVLILANLFFILISLAAGLLRRSRIDAYYGITYFFFFCSCLIFMLNHLGISSYNPIQPNILAWGLFFELLVLSILLTGRFRHISQQSFQLQVRNMQLERDQVRMLLETQESERRRIAADLHDDVGPTLSALLLHVSNLPDDAEERWPELSNYFQKAADLSARAATDVRNISHNLLPKGFTELGLFNVLQNRINELNTLQYIVFRLFSNGDDRMLNAIYSVTLYRIANELVNNIIKHSQASEATIQVLIDSDAIQLQAEDNGIGLDQTIEQKGIGLRNIRSRVTFLKGTINIDTGVQGTSIIINIPLLENGNKNI